MKYMILSTLAMFMIAIGLSYAYAEQQVVITLPLDRPFAEHECKGWNLITASTPGKFRVLCLWDWTFDEALADKINKLTIEKGTNYDEWLKEVLPLIENNPRLQPIVPEAAPTQDSSVPVTPEEKKRIEDQDKKLKKIELCFGGLEQDFAFMAEYEIERIVKEAKRDLTKLDRLAEECYAIENVLRPTANWDYRGMVVREDTTPKTWETELKMSKGSQITPDKMQAEAERARAYIADKSWLNQMLKPNFDNLDQVKMTEQRNAQQLQNEKSALAKSKQLERLDARVTACQIMFENSAAYGNISVKWWRAWLLDGTCDDKLDSFYMLHATNDKYDNLPDLREAKIKQFQEELKKDLRTYK